MVAAMSGPLEGIKVVELGVWVAGPAAGGILADWGAEVIKIEPPQGDPARIFGKMLGGDLPFNPPFELDNRSKRSIVLDLREDDAKEVAAQLLAEADVFITNVRPAGLARIGLGVDEVLAANPRLVYGLITGYGTDGPEADRPAYDIAAFWARAGLADTLSPPDGPLPFQRGGMGDHSTGLALAGAVSAALVARERTGTGQLVSTSLLRQGVYTIGFDVNCLLRFGTPIGKATRETMGNPAINNYSAGDGKKFWLVGLEGDRHWPPLARVVGHPEWLEEGHKYNSPMGRYQHAAELIAEIDAEFAKHSLAEWSDKFDEEPELFWAPVNSMEDVIADEQAHAAGVFVEVPEGASTVTAVATPADFSDTPWAPRSMAPELGEHTDEILAELGRS
jgi:crotonobetainyl-CoA:carnitine CoA-transferase CaiB-like acyl-CoA transferase